MILVRSKEKYWDIEKIIFFGFKKSKKKIGVEKNKEFIIKNHEKYLLFKLLIKNKDKKSIINFSICLKLIRLFYLYRKSELSSLVRLD